MTEFREALFAQPENLAAAAAALRAADRRGRPGALREGTIVLSGIGASATRSSRPCSPCAPPGAGPSPSRQPSCGRAAARLGDAYVLVSQSGASAETVEALERLDGAPVVAVSAQRRQPAGRGRRRLVAARSAPGHTGGHALLHRHPAGAGDAVRHARARRASRTRLGAAARRWPPRCSRAAMRPPRGSPRRLRRCARSTRPAAGRPPRRPPRRRSWPRGAAPARHRHGDPQVPARAARGRRARLWRRRCSAAGAR